jgi:hypothetical protein
MDAGHDLHLNLCDAKGATAMVNAVVPFNQWTFVAATWDGDTGLMKIYTNGVLVAQKKTSVRPFGELEPDQWPGVGIGNLNDGGNNFPFCGDIDEIALYNRALTADEARVIYELQKSGPKLRVAATAAQKNSASPVDLTANYTTTASQFDQITDFPAWKSVPRGTQAFDQVPLKIDGMFCLWGQGCAQRKPPVVFPEATTGIGINRKFETLYVYHGSFYSSPAGTPVCEVVFHYEDGSTMTNQMLYGNDFLDWRVNISGGTLISPTSSNSRLAWVGGSFSPDKIQPLCFCLTAIENPRPQLLVVSVDFYSLKSRTAAVIMALTTGRSGLMQETTEYGPKNAAMTAVQDWLALADAGSYSQTWDTAAASFRADGQKDAWVKLMEKVRQPLGAMVSRKLISEQLADVVAEMPAGSYFVAQFETSFSALPSAVETVEFMQESDGQWRAISYLIRPRTAEQTAAVTAAQKWLAGIDAGNYATSWSDAADYFQGAITQDKWVAALESVRKPLGELKFRTVDSAVTQTQMPGAPDGKYVVMQFETAFANKNSATETVTFVLEKNGQWKADGYYIK